MRAFRTVLPRVSQHSVAIRHLTAANNGTLQPMVATINTLDKI